MTENMAIWEKLSRTDPKHTKGFKRAGGFGGTAIKPIYTIQKMTEEFGPAGQAWGTTEPTFQVVPGSEGQIAVYCTVGLWWVNEEHGHQNFVYGVGGDMVVVKQSAGLRTDDEAFKKAFTDAVGNAMKHLGMSADVHMGLFDDSKYVQEREREERAVAAPTVAGNGSVAVSAPDHLEAALGPSVGSGTLKSSAQAKRDGDWELLKQEIDACQTLPELNLLVASKAFIEAVAPIPKAWKEHLRDYVIEARKEFENPSTPPTAAESLDKLAAEAGKE